MRQEDVDVDSRLGGFHTFHAFIEAISQQFLPDAHRTFYTRDRVFMNEKKVKKENKRTISGVTAAINKARRQLG